MRHVTVFLVCVMFCVSALGANEDDAVRAYAASMARAIIANRDAVLLENFAPLMRKNYSDADLLSPLKKVRDEFGAISKHDFRNTTAGGRIVHDGTEVHVYGPRDEHHEFFGSGPVVAFEVDNFAVARSRLLGAGIEFIYPEPQRAAGKIWQHFRAPDGNVYEIIGDDVAA